MIILIFQEGFQNWSISIEFGYQLIQCVLTTKWFGIINHFNQVHGEYCWNHWLVWFPSKVVLKQNHHNSLITTWMWASQMYVTFQLGIWAHVTLLFYAKWCCTLLSLYAVPLMFLFSSMYTSLGKQVNSIITQWCQVTVSHTKNNQSVEPLIQ